MTPQPSPDEDDYSVSYDMTEEQLERWRQRILADARPLPADFGSAFKDLTDDERDAFLAVIAEG